MVREVDLRNTSFLSPQALFAMEQAPQALHQSAPVAPHSRPLDVSPITISNINPLTHVPQRLEPAVASKDKIAQALEYVESLTPVLGFTPEDPPTFTPDPHLQTNKSGASVVHLQQSFRGVSIFQTGRDVRFKPNGNIRDVTGDSAVVPPDFSVLPTISVADAFKKVLAFLTEHDHGPPVKDQFGQILPAPDMSKYANYVPKVIAAFPIPSKETVLEKGPFDHGPSANLVIFNQYPQLRLAWQFLVSLADNTGDYLILAAAGPDSPGDILYSVETSSHVTARGNVYSVNGAMPREMVEFPRKLSDYPILPGKDGPIPDFPRPWVTLDMTVGNSTQAVLGNTTTALKGKLCGEVLTFDPDDATGDDQKLLNIFYYCCYMHDFFFLLGFDEPAGNFQEINFTQVATGMDSVVAMSHPGAVAGTATMRTPPDGMNPEMNMGLVVSTNRHTAFSADVVFHEFVHGVTNRTVGGRLNSSALNSPQSRGMGEGWSDFFSLTVQNYYRNVDATVLGAWIVSNAGGIRGFPYDDNYPDSFGSLGTGRYAGRAPHPIGEIWCACLMSLNRRFVEALGKEKGYNLTWRVVFDGLQTTAANPSFLDARNEILNALEDIKDTGELCLSDYDKAKDAMKKTFAKFGMGPKAFSNGAFLFGNRPDFEV